MVILNPSQSRFFLLLGTGRARRARPHNPAPSHPLASTHHVLTCCVLLCVLVLQLHDYKPGSSRADLEESRAAARAQQGLEPDSDEVRFQSAHVYTHVGLGLVCCT
jgi:hypothetical protein